VVNIVRHRPRTRVAIGLVALVVSLTTACGTLQPGSMAVGCPKTAVPAGKHLYSLDPVQWARFEAQVAGNDPAIAQNVQALRQAADSALSAGPWSVTQAGKPGPSGDPHDYASLSRYWWPDPSKPDGLPYIRKDGRVNPEIGQYPDEKNMEHMWDTVGTLSHAYDLLHEEKYAARATLLLRTWFLDPATKMNPQITWAQFVPGHKAPRGAGILDSRGLIRVADAITFLQGSSSWSASDEEGMKRWLGEFLDWSLTSKNGKEAQEQPNNHGSWYDYEIAALAAFLGRDDVTRGIVDGAMGNRVAVQIKPDGRQPLELARTKSWDYSTFNLVALTGLAHLARYQGIDLYRCQTPDRTSIQKAVRYLLPYATGSKRWIGQMIVSFDPSRAAYPVAAAAVRFGDAEAARALERIGLGPEDAARSTVKLQAGVADGIKPLNLATIGHTM
jgi:Alginate lyase